ncbi:28 kDa ribonucleoprotein, chloroplastic [Cannabis sativa]|uniref:28 kDa ribonucleoprotein, chloroplastic n=1 Tax=Cannabis sativa TaxID=3483 RepID=UPI0029CA155C|nr:28 kDa ribonucleoprotein, chloroplastic [Cannabis sativa]
MATLEASFSICSFHSSSSSSSSATKLASFPKTLAYPLKLNSPKPTIVLPHKAFFSPLTRKPSFQLCCAVQEIAVEENPEVTQVENQKRKLYVVNLPWSLSVVDIKELFGSCGTVSDVEIIKQEDGKNRGFAFVTMSSGDEAQAAIEKFNLQEVSGRVIRVEFAKRFKKPSPPRPPGPRPGETHHKLYVSNLEWKARSTHLRDLFSENFNPVSARVVFDAPKGRSSGYGFVSFATREEAEAALSSLDGKELLGRPLRLKFSERKVDQSKTQKEEGITLEGETESQKEEETTLEGQTENQMEEEITLEGQTEES